MDLIDTKTAAEIIGITRQGVIAAIKSGNLTAAKLGESQRGTWAIERAEAERYRDERHPARPALCPEAKALGTLSQGQSGLRASGHSDEQESE